MSLKKDIESILLKSRKVEGQEYKNWDAIRLEKHRQQSVTDVVALEKSRGSQLLATLEDYMEVASKHDEHHVDESLLICQAMTKLSATEELLKACTNRSFQWYSRVHAIKALSACGKTSAIRNLLSIVDEELIESEVHVAAIETLSLHDIQDLLPKINKIENSPKLMSYLGLGDHLLAAKGRLGVDSILRPLIKMCYHDSTHKKTLATNALIQFTKKKGGVNGVLDILAPYSIGEAEGNRLKGLLEKKEGAEIKCWAMDTLLQLKPDEAIDALLVCLNSTYWIVANKACRLLSNFHADTSKRLTQLASDTNSMRNARLWAMASLIISSKQSSMSYIKDLDETTVPWPFHCPDIVRSAIIDEYGLHNESLTDVRYIIETTSKERETYDSNEFRDKLFNSLNNEGFIINKIQNCGDYHNQGGGTFNVVHTDKGQFCISTIGPFLTASNINEDMSVNQDTSAVNLLKNTALSLGGLWLEDDLLNQKVPDLNVYFFGHRESLTVQDLIFYWQD